MSTPPRLVRGDLLPTRLSPPKSSLDLNSAREQLGRYEAPGINTLINGNTELILAEALGANVLDTEGNVYIDLVSGFGVALLGHRHPAVLGAIHQQSQRLLHGLGDVYAHPTRIALAQRLVELSPVPDSKIYFAVSGADAVEIALKTAVLATGRVRILAFDPGYHGLSLGALWVSSRPAFRAPFLAQGGKHVTRLPFGADPELVAAELRAGDYAAMIFEPIVGREGVLFPPAGWIDAVVAAAQRQGVVSIADEIFTGFKRTGPLFAHVGVDTEGERAEVDLLCCGKALGGGLPLGAVIGRATLMDSWSTPGEALHTGTFVAHPLSCAAALAVLDELDKPWISERLTALEAVFGALADDLSRGVLAPADNLTMRGRGALWAIDCANRERAARLCREALSRGLLLLAGGPAGNIVQLVPALSMTDAQSDYVCETLRELLA